MITSAKGKRKYFSVPSSFFSPNCLPLLFCFSLHLVSFLSFFLSCSNKPPSLQFSPSLLLLFFVHFFFLPSYLWNIKVSRQRVELFIELLHFLSVRLAGKLRDALCFLKKEKRRRTGVKERNLKEADFVKERKRGAEKRRSQIEEELRK